MSEQGEPIEAIVARWLDTDEQSSSIELAEQLLREVPANSDVQERLRAELLSLSYKEFTATLYWKTVRVIIISRADNRCQLCNKGGHFHIHHRTYETRGIEHLCPWDLVALCPTCHRKFHGIELFDESKPKKKEGKSWHKPIDSVRMTDEQVEELLVGGKIPREVYKILGLKTCDEGYIRILPTMDFERRKVQEAIEVAAEIRLGTELAHIEERFVEP